MAELTAEQRAAAQALLEAKLSLVEPEYWGHDMLEALRAKGFAIIPQKPAPEVADRLWAAYQGLRFSSNPDEIVDTLYRTIAGGATNEDV